MPLLDDLTLGRYHPADSPLHRLDPRLKLAGLPLLAIITFAGAGVGRLGGLALVAGVLLLLGRIPARLCWRGIYALRWLLLFTLLLHLFFSPGRTLFGQLWLSRDGLIQGLLIDARLALAVIFSSLLTLTTSPKEIAAALSSLLSPLRRWLPVHDIVLLFLLVLQFIPILREEAAAESAACRAAADRSCRPPLPTRLASLARRISPLLLRLVDRADLLARRAARGEDIWGEQELPVLRARPIDRLVLAISIVGLVVLAGGLR